MKNNLITGNFHSTLGYFHRDTTLMVAPDLYHDWFSKILSLTFETNFTCCSTGRPVLVKNQKLQVYRA